MRFGRAVVLMSTRTEHHDSFYIQLFREIPLKLVLPFRFGLIIKRPSFFS